MHITVEIPGYDQPVGFPDTMSQAEIDAASKNLYEARRSQPEPWTGGQSTAPEEPSTTLGVLKALGKAGVHAGLSGGGQIAGSALGALTRVPGAPTALGGLLAGGGELAAQKILGEETNYPMAALSGSIGPATSGTMGAAGWLRRLVKQPSADLAAVAQGVEQSAPTLGRAGPEIGQLFEATAGQQGKQSAQEAMAAGVERASEALPQQVTKIPAGVDRVGDQIVRRAASTQITERSLSIPALSDTPIPLPDILGKIRELGKIAFDKAGRVRDTNAADLAMQKRQEVLEQLGGALSKAGPEAKTILDAVRAEYANAKAVSRLFEPDKAGQGALDLGRKTIPNMRDLQGRWIAQEAQLSRGQYEGLAPLREALFRGGLPAQDVTRGIPLPLPARRYLPNQIPLWKSYAGTPLPDPSPMTLDLALRGMLGLGAP